MIMATMAPLAQGSGEVLSSLGIHRHLFSSVSGLIFFSETTGPIGTEIGRNTYWMVL